MIGYRGFGIAVIQIVMCCAVPLGAGEIDERADKSIIRFESQVPTRADAPAKDRTVTVNNWNRSDVVSAYYTEYTPAQSVSMQWSGNAASCNAGTTSQAYIDATFQTINFYRGMVGLPDVTNNASLNAGCQQAALMMSVNNALSHSPPSSWACWTSAGASAAGSSNIALGAAGPSAMSLYVNDSGSGNYFVGHRRWLLCPYKGAFGTGSVGETSRSANALWIFDNVVSRPATPTKVAWPPEGYVPYQVAYNRWSFSLNSDPYASYGSATVTMTENGTPIPLTINTNYNGFCDNTIVWEPTGLYFTPGGADRRITVTVSGIGGTPSSVTYDVVIMDPSISTDEIFSDGFESGFANAWDTTAP